MTVHHPPRHLLQPTLPSLPTDLATLLFAQNVMWLLLSWSVVLFLDLKVADGMLRV